MKDGFKTFIIIFILIGIGFAVNSYTSSKFIKSGPMLAIATDSINETLKIATRGNLIYNNDLKDFKASVNVEKKDDTYIEPSLRKVECESHKDEYIKFINDFLLGFGKEGKFEYRYNIFFSSKINSCAFFLIDNVNTKSISNINFWLFRGENKEQLIHRKYICGTKDCLDKYELERNQILDSYK